MGSNNGLTICTNKAMNFINKKVLVFVPILLSAILIPCIWVMVSYWSECPIVLRIMGITLLSIICLGLISIPFHGMYITKKGNILFIPDFRIKVIKRSDISRISLNFNEWQNSKYSVSVKIKYLDGRFFLKDYAKQFRKMRRKRTIMAAYTIKKCEVDKISEMLSNDRIFCITMIDKNGTILSQIYHDDVGN